MSNGRSDEVSSNRNSRDPQRATENGHESKALVGCEGGSYISPALMILRARAILYQEWCQVACNGKQIIRSQNWAI